MSISLFKDFEWIRTRTLSWRRTLTCIEVMDTVIEKEVDMDICVAGQKIVKALMG
jgi:hypothetical protein